MKKLQNNFTTPEQSKRLLELGVPADSADCFYQLNPLGNLLGDTPTIISFNLDVNEIVWDEVYAIPCWSVGRLIEIYCLATGIEYIKIGTSEISLIELMIKMIEIAVKVKTFDFSKLDEL